MTTAAAPAVLTSGGTGTVRERADLMAGVAGATTCLLPLLTPAGPGNTALADLGIASTIVVAALWTARERIPLMVPYGVGVVLMMVGGALAATLADAPLSTSLVLAQDVLLLLWAVSLALGRHHPMLLRAVTHAWCRTAPVYSALVVIAYLIGFSPLSGVTAKDGVRAAYTFGDPNLAANYLVVSLLMMAACQRPRSPGVRKAAYLVVLVALGFTGSNGGMVSLVIGILACVALNRYRERGTMAGVLALAVSAATAVMMVGVVLPHLDTTAIREKAAGSIPLLRDSIGRSSGSTSERATIVKEGYHLYLSGDALGLGPALTKSTLQARQAPYVKEAHNDYLAVLLERGSVGVLGLILLGFSIAGRCGRLIVAPVPPALADAVPRAWLLAAILPVMAVAAGFYEVLHFRHLWTWLGVVAAVFLTVRDQGAPR